MTINERELEILEGIKKGLSPKELKLKESEKAFYEIEKKQFEMIGDKNAFVAWAPVEE